MTKGVCGFRGTGQLPFLSNGVNPVAEDPQSQGVYDCDPAHCCKLADQYRQKLLDLHPTEKTHLFQGKAEIARLSPEERAGLVILRQELALVAAVETCADLVQYDARLPRRAAVMANNTIARQVHEQGKLPEELAKLTREMVGAPPAPESASPAVPTPAPPAVPAKAQAAR